MHYTIRPLVDWNRPDTEDRQSRYVFRADWNDTMRILADEVERIGGDHFVLELDVDESDIRIDGSLRANAAVATPRVRVSFESIHGPLRYATDAYDYWRTNVRAVALGLRALRAVDRYGISSRAEQYVGYKAIGAGNVAIGASTMDRDVALSIISVESGYSREALSDDTVLRDAIRKAKRRTHPDVYKGDGEPWNAVDNAERALFPKADPQ